MLIPSATAAAVFRLGSPPAVVARPLGSGDGGRGGRSGRRWWVGLRSVGLVLDGGRQRVGTRFVVI